jgi:hypothetical protein
MNALYDSEANAISIHLAAVTSIDRNVEVHPCGTVGFAGEELVEVELLNVRSGVDSPMHAAA